MKAKKKHSAPEPSLAATGSMPRGSCVKSSAAPDRGSSGSACTRSLLVAGSCLAATLMLTGCGTPAWISSVKENPPNWLTPYRVDIGQGNYVSESMAAKLKEGLSKDQVRAILGTPLLVDPFRSDRWDYIFDIRRGDGEKERRRFTVIFKDDALTSFGGDPLPKEGGEGILPSRPAR